MNVRLIQAAMGVTLGLMAVAFLLFRSLSPTPADEGPDPGGLLPHPYPAPALSLAEPDGRALRLRDLRGRYVAIFFGYTNCPDVCPLTLSRLGRIQEERGSREPALEILFVTVDPDRDSPERLRSYVGAMAGRIRPLQGAEAEVHRQAFDFGVTVTKRELETLPAGEYLVDHTARTFLVDPEGEIVATLPPLASAEEMETILAAAFGDDW